MSGLAKALGRAGVAPVIDLSSLNGVLHPPGKASPHGPAIAPMAGALVSCLMVTSGERRSIRCALECYRRQLYENRELVIVTYHDRAQVLRELVAASGVTGTSVHSVGRDLSLGEMRNVSIARSSGAVLVNWDDDDLFDPARLSLAQAMLANPPAVAATLWRVLFWWPDRQVAAVSEGRLWEPSLAVRRDHAPVYRSLGRLEDTHALECLTSTRSVLSYDLPLLYVYVVHGANTCEPEHFEWRLEQADSVFRGDDYLELMQLLGERMPIADYQTGVFGDDPLGERAASQLAVG